MTGIGPDGGRDPRRPRDFASADVHSRPSRRPRQEAADQAWDEEVTRLLHRAAAIREERERARSDEDARSTRAQAAALLEAIRAHGRPQVKHYVTRPRAQRAPTSAQALP